LPSYPWKRTAKSSNSNSKTSEEIHHSSVNFNANQLKLIEKKYRLNKPILDLEDSVISRFTCVVLIKKNQNGAQIKMALKFFLSSN
jgi:hypothetical protein